MNITTSENPLTRVRLAGLAVGAAAVLAATALGALGVAIGL